MCTEDNELNVEILKELLKIESAECTICENGEKILEEFEYYDLGEYDMILMDVQMPVVNGYEVQWQSAGVPMNWKRRFRLFL